ncbi:MAG: RNA polymerase factor sigma-54 [Thermacetogeniaceae bacterium]|jgi:RNA polymerase sigma-54 factor|nr:RNA polymerase factor sigma-54 [Syntrophomonadaceae bacterium]
MRLSYGMKLEQTQKLIMTPELRQAIMVLQLSSMDLAQYIENALLENPLLELSEEEAEEKPPTDKKKDDFTQEWCDYLAECGQIDRSFDRAWAEQEEKEQYNLEHFVPQIPTLHEHLYLQLRLVLSEPEDMEIGEFLIGNINDRGYLNISLKDASLISGYGQHALERVLKMIQSLDPPGVGARDLKECLLIQLEQRGQRTPLIEKIVDCYLNDIANGNLLKIASSLGLTVQEVQQQADLIKSLDPIPGRNFLPGDNRYITPDVVVEKVNDEYVIIVNDVAVPRLKINRNYQLLINQKNNCDSGTVEFIQDKMKSALWLIRSIEQRRLTLYRVVQCIVDYQREFLDRGIKYLKPLNLKDIAEKADMHESTVSRAIANKYIQTPQGLFELKFFFTSGVENAAAGKMVATETIKQLIKEIVEGEDPYEPYSDQQICEMLTSKGINIARRTIAKYRKEIGIPPMRQRKRYR